MDVRVVPATSTRALRQRVLRAHQTLDELAREDDEEPDAVHFAAIDRDGVIGTAFVHRAHAPWAEHQLGAWRLRGMATDEARRQQQVGTAVLNAVIAHVAEHGGRLLWCNARTPAVGFYESAGFAIRGESWDEPMLGPHVAMERPIPAAADR